MHLLGGLTITFWLACAHAQESDCITSEDISTKEMVEIYKEVKPTEQFNITCCVINRVSCLSITEETLMYKSSNDTTILNESAIQGTYLQETEGNYIYGCKCGNNKFRQTYVSVGKTPKNVKSMDCFVTNFLQMNCTVDVLQEPIFPTYLFFLDGSKIKATNNYGSFVLDLTEIKYSTGRQFFEFAIKSTNSMGSNRETIKFDQYSIAKPKLKDVKFTNITANSCKLSWNIQNYAAFKNYTNGLVFNISLKAEKFDFFENFNKHQIQNHNDYFWVEFPNLYSFVKYKVHLCAKANSTANIERMWSEKFEKNFTTLWSLPKSPKIDIGNFYIHPDGKNISLFWQEIPEYEKNGPNFNYVIYEIKENGREIQRYSTIYKNSASIKLDWKYTSQYEFKLKSQNEAGYSSDANVLKIAPRSPYITHKQQEWALTKLSYNQNIIVSWLKPTKYTAFSNFTLYWCNAAGVESDNQCTGPINFMTLKDRNALNYTTEKLNTSLNFALSENYYNGYSSGMMWAKKCIPKGEIKLNSVTIATEDSITVQWFKECWHMPIIDKLFVNYCENDTNNWAEDYILDRTEDHKIIALKPSTSYKITIKAILRTGSELISEPIYAKTKNEKHTIKVIIIACVSIIGIVLLIALAYYSQRRIRRMMQIKVVLPTTILDDEDDVNKTKSNVNNINKHQNSVHNAICTEDCEELIRRENFKSPQIISKDNNYVLAGIITQDNYVLRNQLATKYIDNTSKKTVFTPTEYETEISCEHLTPYLTAVQVKSNDYVPMAMAMASVLPTPTNDQMEKSNGNLTQPQIISEDNYVIPQQLVTEYIDNTSKKTVFTPTEDETEISCKNLTPHQIIYKNNYVTPEQVQSNNFTPMARVFTPTDDQTKISCGNLTPNLTAEQVKSNDYVPMAMASVLPTPTDGQTETSNENLTPPQIMSHDNYVLPQQLASKSIDNTSKKTVFTPTEDETEISCRNPTPHQIIYKDNYVTNNFTPMARVFTPKDDQTKISCENLTPYLTQGPVKSNEYVTIASVLLKDGQTEKSYENLTPPQIMSQDNYVIPQQTLSNKNIPSTKLSNNNTPKPPVFTPTDDQTENDQEIVQLLATNNLGYEYL